MRQPDLLEQAVRNNAAWCEAVCRAHGGPGIFEADLCERGDDLAQALRAGFLPLGPQRVWLRA